MTPRLHAASSGIADTSVGWSAPRLASADRHGISAIERIDLATGEVSTVVEGLGKPVGVVKLGSALVVTDARRGAVLRVDLVAGGAARCVEVVTGIDRPDSIAICGGAVVLTTFCVDRGIGSVRKLWLDGTITTIARGRWEPRGIASDGERAFILHRHSPRRSGPGAPLLNELLEGLRGNS